MILNTWCPSSFDNTPYVLISLPNITYITRLNIKSLNLYYHLEYTRDNSINEYTIWRSYSLLNNKDEIIQLNPPIIAKHIRLTIKQMQTNICFQFEFFGCIFTDGVISYNMLQGSNQLEDDTYDGEYNEKHRYLYSKEKHLIENKAMIYFFFFFKMVSDNYLMDKLVQMIHMDFNG
jgi:hypothetical protein